MFRLLSQSTSISFFVGAHRIHQDDDSTRCSHLDFHLRLYSFFQHLHFPDKSTCFTKPYNLKILFIQPLEGQGAAVPALFFSIITILIIKSIIFTRIKFFALIASIIFKAVFFFLGSGVQYSFMLSASKNSLYEDLLNRQKQRTC